MQQLPIKPPLQGEVPPQAAEGCGAWPCKYPSGPPRSLRSTYYTLGSGGRPVADAGVGQRPNRFMAPCRSTVQPQHRTRQRTAASTAP